MLDSLAPARRRLVLGGLGLALLLVVVVAVVLVLRRDPPVEPVAQDRPGPVLLVPGYGGSTASLQVLADALDEAGRGARIVRPAGPGGPGPPGPAPDPGGGAGAGPTRAR